MLGRSDTIGTAEGALAVHDAVSVDHVSIHHPASGCATSKHRRLHMTTTDFFQSILPDIVRIVSSLGAELLLNRNAISRVTNTYKRHLQMVWAPLFQQV